MSSVLRVDNGLLGRDRLPQWLSLEAHSYELRKKSLFNLFASDPSRTARFSLNVGPFHLDFSKQRIESQTLQKLADLAQACELREAIAALFSGATLNHTEGRAALHTALRVPREAKSPAGHERHNQVHATLDKMAQMVDRIHKRNWRGYSGKPIRDIVNIGVGGSDLGPFMACFALEEFRAVEAAPLNFHFASSMDGTQVSHLLKRLSPETTLFIISSKSFTTIDTLSNAATAIAWLETEIADQDILMRQHIIGVSSAAEKMNAFGIPEQNQLHLWDWVGGRFSMWSAIGLPIALKFGMDGFRSMLAGAHFIDEHFRSAPLTENLPVIFGMIGVWNASFLHIGAHAVLPYDGRLKYLPHYLSQLEMESNGKSISNDGHKVSYPTCPILWGEVGPNAQHAFYQLLHQGTQAVSSMFVAAINRYSNEPDGAEKAALKKQQTLALANCLAQTRVLAFGDEAIAGNSSKPAHMRYDGNQPSSTLLIDELTPYSLGALIASYEHKVFVMSVLWNINPFDQWGVELGKQIAFDMQSQIESGAINDLDSSSASLVDVIRQRRSN